MLISESLVTVYPVPDPIMLKFALKRKLVLNIEVETELLTSEPYLLVEADIKMWLATAPEISQAGLKYTLTQADKDQLKAEAEDVFERFGVPYKRSKPIFGYKGTRL